MDVLTYAFVLGFLTISPGPLSATLVTQTLAGDHRSAIAFGAGIVIGCTLITLFVCGAMNSWLASASILFTTAISLSVGYILWIALCKLRSNGYSAAVRDSQSKRPVEQLGAGVVACMASPQTLFFYLAWLPNQTYFEDISLKALLFLGATTVASLTAAVVLTVTLADPIRARLCRRTDQPIAATDSLAR